MKLISVYYRFGGGQGVIMCLYVDDILIFGTNLNVIEEVKSFLSQSFEMKDMGVADVTGLMPTVIFGVDQKVHRSFSIGW